MKPIGEIIGAVVAFLLLAAVWFCFRHYKETPEERIERLHSEAFDRATDRVTQPLIPSLLGLLVVGAVVVCIAVLIRFFLP